MTKKNLLDVIDNVLPIDEFITLVEVLDNEQKNLRTMFTDKTDLKRIISDFFDDNLHGHAGDGQMTTIVSYII